MVASARGCTIEFNYVLLYLLIIIFQVKKFLEDRHIGYLINTFAPGVDVEKSMDLGLAYGDIIVYKQVFKIPYTEQPSYK